MRIFLRTLWAPYTNRFKEMEQAFIENVSIIEKEALVQELLNKQELRAEKSRRAAFKKEQNNGELPIRCSRWFNCETKFPVVKKRAEVLGSLDAEDFEEVHNQNSAKRHGTTGTWLLESLEYNDWMRSPKSKLLWCYGNRKLPTID
jgi:hypothetical protein